MVQRLGVCSGRMEEGALRVDANVSTHREGQPLGTRTEVKNIGSVRGVAAAVKYESDRQRSVLERGGYVAQETRMWDAQDRVTVALRDKELAHDYRYMPEPNLPPLRVNLQTLEDHPDIISVPLLRQKIPELPEETRQNLTSKYKLRQEAAIQIVNEPVLLQHFFDLQNPGRDPVKIANVLLNEYLSVLNKEKADIEDSRITKKELGEIIDLLSTGVISLDISKLVLTECLNLSPSNVREIVDRNNWALENRDEEISKICKTVIDNNPDIVKKYKAGKTKLFKALLGFVAKNTQKKYNMSLVAKKMDELLKN